VEKVLRTNFGSLCVEYDNLAPSVQGGFSRFLEKFFTVFKRVHDFYTILAIARFMT